MRAVTWQARGEVRVADVPEPRIEKPTDIVVRITSTAICGSDLHLYGPLTPFMTPGDVLGHEGMGVVEETGSAITSLVPGDRVVIPFNIACGSCFMCARGLTSQCETTQLRHQGTGGALFGYSELYGRVPGAQAELVRVPEAQYGPIKVPGTAPDDRWLFLSDILPTAWQAVRYAGLRPGETIAVLGLGPVGQLVARCAQIQRAGRVIAVDPLSERTAIAERHGAEVADARAGDVAGAVRALTDGRGADCVVDAVGMEAYGSPLSRMATALVTTLPRGLAAGISKAVGVDRLAALTTAIGAVRRGGTISLVGVYGGAVDPINLRVLFDKQVTLRMGQANVRQWTSELLDLLCDEDDHFGVEGLASHHLPLEEAPEAYRSLKKREPGWLKVVLQP